MAKRKEPRLDRPILGLIGVVIWGGVFIYFQVVRPILYPEQVAQERAEEAAAKAAAQQEIVRLEEDFKTIVQFPGATLTNYTKIGATDKLFISASFAGDPPVAWTKLRDYYTAELASHGWRFDHEDSVKEWWQDLGDKSAIYCKGAYEASLFFWGEKSGNYGNFGLHVGRNDYIKSVCEQQ